MRVDDALVVRRRPAVGRRLTGVYRPTLGAPAEARALVEEACRRWRIAGRPADQARMIVTELVGNAVVHAGTPLRVVLRRSPRYLRIEVWDGSTDPARIRGRANPDTQDGRGLVLVEAFAATWGCTPRAWGKVTWAVVAPHGR